MDGGLLQAVRIRVHFRGKRDILIWIDCVCRHGQWVSAHPYLVIALTFLATVLGGVGLMNFHWEANAIRLWIPSNSDFTKDFNFLWNNHPPEMRFHSVLFTTTTEENILQPKYFRQVSDRARTKCGFWDKNTIAISDV